MMIFKPPPPALRKLRGLDVLICVSLALGCREGPADVAAEAEAAPTVAASSPATAGGSTTSPHPASPSQNPGAQPALGVAAVPADAAAPPLVTVDELKTAEPQDGCPETMRYVTGGEFWMGSPRGRGAEEERPRFLTRVADFCMDTYEVTAEHYARCVAAGQCTMPQGSQRTCNYGRREGHPINCVDWHQADAYCKSEGSRLPSELEWEYAARGGASYSPFSWGSESPDGRTCWKSNQTCSVGSFAAGAFGLHDVSGNVWEWNADWFGEYPWPNPSGRAKVFRGGSWSRRFDKWLRTTLRNRTNPESWGSHLGFRCARAAKNAPCPFGVGAEPGTCRHGVLEADCEDPRQRFNGLRCALPGAPECGANQQAMPGYGCVSRAGSAVPTTRLEDGAPEETPTRARSPEFDEDCQKNQPKRSQAYLLEGGTHAGRNRHGAQLDCKNRDVGVGWNSVCCP